MGGGGKGRMRDSDERGLRFPQVNSDIQSLFMGLDGLCRKYSKDIIQIAQFQEKHRRHLLTHYREKIVPFRLNNWKHILKEHHNKFSICNNCNIGMHQRR
uniref:Uncharacterized protein n=1 Tax=Micrurus carvalhoi TaxID=3147026 RepID=A0A2H6N2V6_9SAUR